MNGNVELDLADSIRAFGDAISKVAKENPWLAGMSILATTVLVALWLFLRYLKHKETEKTKRHEHLHRAQQERRQGAMVHQYAEEGDTP